MLSFVFFSIWKERALASMTLHLKVCHLTEEETLLIPSCKSFILNAIWWFVVRGSWFVVVVFYVPTVLQYRNFLKILSEDFAHALSSGFLQKCLEEELSSD